MLIRKPSPRNKAAHRTLQIQDGRSSNNVFIRVGRDDCPTPSAVTSHNFIGRLTRLSDFIFRFDFTLLQFPNLMTRITIFDQIDNEKVFLIARLIRAQN